ncbi:MAG: hypothetical protein HFH12_00770 [Dorea sp.]|nr:hypothetical protein [Dorea sp.]
MKNVYDIRHEKNLIYILPQAADTVGQAPNSRKNMKTAVILYLYYLDTLPVYWPYIDRIPESIDVYIVSSREDVLEAVRQRITMSGRQMKYMLKENRGRDVSALLVASADIVKEYKYICFLHDKKARSEAVKEDTDLWIENLWGNLLGGPGCIDSILQLFEGNPRLGILAPPEPIGDHFCTWYGYGWHKSFEITRELAEKLELSADLAIEKPPITIGTALWFKREALQKLFDFGWEYTDFDDSGLNGQHYVSYGVERIFPYVAQDAGFETGTVMTISYAERQTNYIQYSTGILFSEAKHFFPVPCVHDLERYKKNRESMLRFVQNNRDIYLYGAGEMGRFCFFLLSEQNVLPKGYLVSGTEIDTKVCGLPVYSIQDMDSLSGCAVIITVLEERIQKEIVENLREKGIYHYHIFWNS